MPNGITHPYQNIQGMEVYVNSLLPDIHMQYPSKRLLHVKYEEIWPSCFQKKHVCNSIYATLAEMSNATVSFGGYL